MSQIDIRDEITSVSFGLDDYHCVLASSDEAFHRGGAACHLTVRLYRVEPVFRTEIQAEMAHAGGSSYVTEAPARRLLGIDPIRGRSPSGRLFARVNRHLANEAQTDKAAWQQSDTQTESPCRYSLGRMTSRIGSARAPP
jgi:hypothetical protein